MSIAAPDAFLFRRAVPDDCDEIRSLLIETWHAAYDGIMGESFVAKFCENNFFREAIQSYIWGGASTWFGVAVCDSKVIGMATVRIGLFGQAKLDMLYVHPKYQGFGIGSALMEAVIKKFPWARSVVLEVLEPNFTAIQFYERHGFAKFATIKDGMRANVPIVWMWRQQQGASDGVEALVEFIKMCWRNSKASRIPN